ncbi:hypothetical protein AB6884_00695 [Carnobacterium maltaromaticum]|uniref:hypothetical protein n=1 Tax=Carnobacterium maltaromaticum TaxID=2751 RepID=UPI0039BE4643
MKKVKIIGMSLLFSSVLFFNNVLTVGAEEINNEIPSEEILLEEDSNEDFVEMYPLQINELEVLNFFTEEDRDSYINNQQQFDSGIQSRSGVKTRDIFISSKKYTGKFLGYNSLTPNWSYASSYTITKNKNVTFSTGYTYDGVSANLTVSQSYGVAITLPANSSKASRLAAKGDVTISKYRVEAYYGNTVTKTFYILRTSPAKNITNYVSYR